MLPIAIDVMSGDLAPRERMAGALHALARDPGIKAFLAGDPRMIGEWLAGVPPGPAARIEIVPASEVVMMNEPPRDAVRHKKQSSMRLTVDLVKQGRAAACVSAGNTGALTAIAHFVLKSLPGAERAAIVAPIPAAHGHTLMLDLGANTQATPLQLLQFAHMGHIIARDVHGIRRPRIGLLNIGQEDIKGGRIVQAAHALLAAGPFNYVGFVEGHDIFAGTVDVVVTDGFTGNVALKTMEGVAGMIAGRLRQEFRASWGARVAGVVARGALRRAAAGLDPRRHNGACMVGLGGIVVKSHGSADALAFSRAVATAALASRCSLTERITQALAPLREAQDTAAGAHSTHPVHTGRALNN